MADNKSLLSGNSSKASQSDSLFSGFSEGDIANIGVSAIRAGGSAFQGFSDLSDAKDIQVAGYKIAEKSLDNSATEAIALGQYNSALDSLRTQRAIQAKERMFKRVVGKQRVQQAASGLRGSSQSFLSVANETLAMATRDILRMKEDAEQRQENIMFSAASRATQANQMKQQIQFQKEVDEFRRGVQKAEAIGGFIQQAGSLASGSIDSGSLNLSMLGGGES